MKNFNMYVKTIIRSEHDKVLLLKEKHEHQRPLWDLPGCLVTEDESFDEAVIEKIPKQIGYLTYPGQIIGTTTNTTKDNMEMYIIMECKVISGQLLLSEEYESNVWIDLRRITEYPLVPWLNNYVKHEEHPFNDVKIEIEEMEEMEDQKRDSMQDDLSGYDNRISTTMNDNYRSPDISQFEPVPEQEEEDTGSEEGSMSLLRNAISRTFHPREAEVTQSEPKPNLIHDYEEKEPEDAIEEKFNVKFHENEDEPAITIENSPKNVNVQNSDNKAQKENHPLQDQMIIEEAYKKPETEEIYIDHDGDEPLEEAPSELKEEILHDSPGDIVIDHDSDDENKQEDTSHPIQDGIIASEKEEEAYADTEVEQKPKQESKTETKQESKTEPKPKPVVEDKISQSVQKDNEIKPSFTTEEIDLDEIIHEDEMPLDDTLESTEESPDIDEVLVENEAPELSQIEEDTTPKHDPIDDFGDNEEIIIDHSDEEVVDQYDKIKEAYNITDETDNVTKEVEETPKTKVDSETSDSVKESIDNEVADDIIVEKEEVPEIEHTTARTIQTPVKPESTQESEKQRDLESKEPQNNQATPETEINTSKTDKVKEEQKTRRPTLNRKQPADISENIHTIETPESSSDFPEVRKIEEPKIEETVTEQEIETEAVNNDKETSRSGRFGFRNILRRNRREDSSESENIDEDSDRIDPLEKTELQRKFIDMTYNDSEDSNTNQDEVTGIPNKIEDKLKEESENGVNKIPDQDVKSTRNNDEILVRNRQAENRQQQATNRDESDRSASWRERLDDINKTDANKKKKVAPKPRGKR